MAKQVYPKCPKCRKWTVGGANYCHHCGYYLKSNPNAFNSELAPAPVPTKPRHPGSNNHKVILAEGGLITVLAVADVIALGQEYYTLAIGLSIPLAVFTIPKLAPAISGFIVDVKTVWVSQASGTPESITPKQTMLHVEHIDEHGRPRLLYDFPEEIEIEHLIHIATVLDRGKSYSRRNMIKPGKLSQTQFEIITTELLSRRNAKKKYPDADNSPVILRAGGHALFDAAKNHQKPVVVGGGWGTGSKSGPLVVGGWN